MLLFQNQLKKYIHRIQSYDRKRLHINDINLQIQGNLKIMSIISQSVFFNRAVNLFGQGWLMRLVLDWQSGLGVQEVLAVWDAGLNALGALQIKLLASSVKQV